MCYCIPSHEQEHTLWQFRDLIINGNPDILQPDVVMAGGITELRKVYTLDEAFNKPVMPHCPSAGVSSAASMHLYSTITSAIRPHEYSFEFSAPQEEMESLFEEPFVVEGEEAIVPDRSGFGLVINE